MNGFLGKGVVIAGDISVSLVEIDLMTIMSRLLVASVDRAVAMGINWWQSDPHLSLQSQNLVEENKMLRERLDRLENTILSKNECVVGAEELRR